MAEPAERVPMMVVVGPDVVVAVGVVLAVVKIVVPAERVPMMVVVGPDVGPPMLQLASMRVVKHVQ